VCHVNGGLCPNTSVTNQVGMLGVASPRASLALLPSCAPCLPPCPCPCSAFLPEPLPVCSLLHCAGLVARMPALQLEYEFCMRSNNVSTCMVEESVVTSLFSDFVEYGAGFLGPEPHLPGPRVVQAWDL